MPDRLAKFRSGKVQPCLVKRRADSTGAEQQLARHGIIRIRADILTFDGHRYFDPGDAIAVAQHPRRRLGAT